MVANTALLVTHTQTLITLTHDICTTHSYIPVVPLEEQRFADYALDCSYCILMPTLDIISHDFPVFEGLLASEC